jgi:hypothetical protein
MNSYGIRIMTWPEKASINMQMKRRKKNNGKLG